MELDNGLGGGLALVSWEAACLSQAMLSSPRHSPGSSAFDSSFMARMSNFDSFLKILILNLFPSLVVFVHDFLIGVNVILGAGYWPP